MDAFIVTELESSEEYTLVPNILNVDHIFHPHPPYESGAPISRSIMVGDDSDYLPFLPFADDPSYNFQLDIDEHSYFRWDNHPGPVTNPVDPVTKPSHNPEQIVNYFLQTFCNNLNCITGFCMTHFETQTPSFNAPKVLYENLGDNIAHPCGVQCFLYPTVDATSIASVTVWTASDIQLLFSFLNYAPDASSCDLATICRKPCREVHTERENYISPAKPAEKGNQSTHKNYDESSKVFTPQLPCKHEGACNARSECSCLLNWAHCHTRCGCAKSCSRRWKGCSCATSRSGKVCGTKRCSCSRANFECDPEVCLSYHTSDMCQNVAIQRGKFKQTEVRESSWGLGLYVLEPCRKDELITEYVGELIYEPTLGSRDLAANHRKRSYVFVLNKTFSVDSSRAGNPSKYINHSSTPNCSTSVYLVNGEHRIAVSATCPIQTGEELFIDYGPVFFKETSNNSASQPPSVETTFDQSSDSIV